MEFLGVMVILKLVLLKLRKLRIGWAWAFNVAPECPIPARKLLPRVQLFLIWIGRSFQPSRKRSTAVGTSVFGKFFLRLFEGLLRRINLVLQVFQSYSRRYVRKLRPGVLHIEIRSHLKKQLNRYVLRAKVRCVNRDLICKRWVERTHLLFSYTVPNRKDHPTFFDISKGQPSQFIFGPMFAKEVGANHHNGKP